MALLLGSLLGLLGVGGGALAQESYLRKQAAQDQAGIAGLLGRAPDSVPDGGYSNPDPGSGLMQDIGDPRKQAEFAMGLMGLSGRGRAAATQLFDGIMARASQAGLQREGWGRQEAAAAVAEGNADRRYQQTFAQIDTHFDRSEAQRQAEFRANEARWGTEFAYKQSHDAEQLNLQRRTEARLGASARLNDELHRVQIAAAQGAKLPTGYEYVAVPAAGGGQRVVSRPVPGTEHWVAGQDKVNAINQQRQNVADYRRHLEEHGLEQFGTDAGTQRELYARVRSGIGVLNNSGVMNVGDLPIIEAEMPDPTALMRGPLRVDTLLAHLDSLDKSYQKRQDNAQRVYQGWGLQFYDPRAAGAAPGGRDKPPAGSKPLGSR